ncbi:transcriptional regulator, LysR family [Cognatiyoonia koreensis]|uniref:Transcriptional regulator, LysR family n=1 Tax=Cognatiyoonia koreensis TaxID=364200 RepID=A0A1I0QVU5_9RHOB|nr:LysR family transcriptional regulator [Cognatiyoonia koreensis]SEW31608.1 transcriptional regulator, LysR family [Cognatiyoonia koreensis]
MDSWDEVRTAYQVARSGTVSGAADVLGVHHATVIRHIDALEGRLGVKLFQRHARGYTATEAGADLLQVAQATDDQFTQLAGRIKGLGEGLSGDLVITSLGTVAAMVVPIVVAYQIENPDIRVRFLTGDRLFRLEYGEAHVAIRAGQMPSEPDNVVQPFTKQRMAMVASQSYLDRAGRPTGEDDLKNHSFVSHDDVDTRAPFSRWLMDVGGITDIAFRATDTRVMKEAILAGAGIGFVAEYELSNYPTLVPIMESKPEWAASLWLVTHVDLHRTVKVQSFLTFLKAHTKDWPR